MNVYTHFGEDKSMPIKEERTKILNMIAEGKITAEEGIQLLSVLRSTASKTRSTGTSTAEARFLRVRVTHADSGKVKVNVNIPMSLVNVGLRMGARFAPDLEGIDFDEIVEAIQLGERGKVVDVEDEESGEHIEVFVE